MKKFLSFLALALTAAIFLASCGTSNVSSTPSPKTAAGSSQTAQPEVTLDPALTENTVNITITLTDGRTIKAELYPDIAPITVENFKNLCAQNFYNGLIFHRVINGFMIQGGGFDENLTQKSADTIKGEFSQNGVTNNLSHKRGVLSMARTQQSMDSASSQFFIVQKDSTYLDGQYAAFGKVTEGMDVVDDIAKTEVHDVSRSMENVPVTPIVIQSITVDE